MTYISSLNMRLITCTSVHKWSENQSFAFFPQQIQPPSLTRKAFKAPISTYIYNLIFSFVSENNRRPHSIETSFNKVDRKWVKRLATKVPVVRNGSCKLIVGGSGPVGVAQLYLCNFAKQQASSNRGAKSCYQSKQSKRQNARVGPGSRNWVALSCLIFTALQQNFGAK